MAEPSKPMPSLNAPSSSAGAMATDFRKPSTSATRVDLANIPLSMVRSSVCLSMRFSLPSGMFQSGYIRGVGGGLRWVYLTFNAIGITVADMAASSSSVCWASSSRRRTTPSHVDGGSGRGPIMFDTTAGIHSFNPDWQPGGRPSHEPAFECAGAAESTVVAQIAQAGFTVDRAPDASQRYATVLTRTATTSTSSPDLICQAIQTVVNVL